MLRPALGVLAGRSRWLVSLDIGGRVVRLSTEGPVTITGKDGEVYPFVGGLVPANFERSLDLWASTASPRSLSFETLLDFDLARDVARGIPIFAASGELAQWYEGQQWEDRRVVLRGMVQEPAIGAMGEPFAFALVEDPADDLTILPPSSWVVEAGVTMPEAGSAGPSPQAVGNHYPIVIGSPGQAVGVGTTSASLVDQVPAVPALLVKREPTASTKADHWIMLCGGFSPATSVRIYNSSNPAKTFTTTAIVHGYDLLSQPFSYVLPDTGGNSPEESDALYSIWDPATGGGLQSPYSAGSLRGAGDVIRWALSESTIRIDHGRLAELSILNSYKIDSYINTPTSPWGWLLSEVLPLLPVSVGTGPDGLFVVPWLARALEASQAVDHLETGRNCTREGAAVYTSVSDVYNHLTIQFAPSADGGTFARHRTLSGDRVNTSDPNTAPGYWCRRSAAIFGRRSLSVEASVVYDLATADAILGDLERRHSHPRREIIYSLPRRMDWLRPGDVVTLTDPDLHLSSVVALVGSIAYGEDALSCQIILFEPSVFSQ